MVLVLVVSWHISLSRLCLCSGSVGQLAGRTGMTLLDSVDRRA